MASKTGYTDFARRTFEPARQLNEVILGNVERVARFQFELAGDLMQFTFDQLRVASQAKDLPTLLARQREALTKFSERATQRQQGLAELATQAQAGFAQWFENATSIASGKPA
jgi:phasin family protein